MQIKTREVCENCEGTGCVSWVDHAGMTREDIHEDCEGTGWIEKWPDIEEPAAIHSFFLDLTKIITAHGLELAANHEALFALADQIDSQVKCIQRLEQIILAMAKGTESTPPDDGPGHTHWVYPLHKAQGLTKDIKEAK